MYRTFFHLDAAPFEPEPDSRFIVLTDTHREALATLIYALDQREGWALIYGEAGLGKTTMLKALMMRMDPQVVAGVVARPAPDILELCNQAALTLHLAGPFASKGEFFEALRALLEQRRAQGGAVLLVIDEAERLTPAQLGELRLMANADTGESRTFNLFLSAQPLIQTLLAQAQEAGLGQHLHRQWRITPLGKADTAHYLERRLRVAGGDPAIFPPETVELIHLASQGVPAAINVLGLKCLQEAARLEQAQVSPTLANQAWQELGPLEGGQAPAAAPLEPSLYEGMGLAWNPCANPAPRPELNPQEQHLENRLMNRSHGAYQGLAWWDKTTQFTVEWDNLRRRRLGVLGPAFPSFCPRWVDQRWEAFNLARRDADYAGALYTDWLHAQYRRVLGQHLGELPLAELYGPAAREAYAALTPEEKAAGPQPVKPPVDWDHFDPQQPEHAQHAEKALEEIFDLASQVCAQQRRGAEDLVTEAVCQTVLPLKALRGIPKLHEQVSQALARLGQGQPPLPDPLPQGGRPPLVI